MPERQAERGGAPKAPMWEESKLSLQDALLAEILPAISKLQGNYCREDLIRELAGNEKLKELILDNRHLQLIAKRKILGCLPYPGKYAVADFISELLESGGLLPC